MQRHHLPTVVLPLCLCVVSKLLLTKESFLPHLFIYVLVYVAGINSRNFQLLPWLVILYCLNYLLSSFIHLTIRTSFILASMSLWHSSTILVCFSFWRKSYPKLLRLPSGWISRVIHHFFGWWRYKTWSLPLSWFCSMTIAVEYNSVSAHVQTQTYKYICIYQHTYVKTFLSVHTFLYILGNLSSFCVIR